MLDATFYGDSQRQYHKLLLFLHGLGGNKDSVHHILSDISDEYLICAPNGPHQLHSNGFAWYRQIENNRVDSDLLDQSFVELTDLILRITTHWDLDEVVISGFSQGGLVATSYGLCYPEYVDRAISIAGYVPEHIINQEHDELWWEAAKEAKHLWVHGDRDMENHTQWAREHSEWIIKNGVSMEYKEYPNLGHTISPDQVEYINKWLADV
jgi:predicted esterase